MAFDLTGKAVKKLRLPTVDYSGAPINIVSAQKGDTKSRYLLVSMYDDFGDINLSKYTTVMLSFTGSDGNIKTIAGEIDGDLALCQIPTEISSSVKRHDCNIIFSSSNSVLTSQTFYVLVNKSNTSEEYDEASDDYSEFTALLTDLNRAIDAAQQIEESIPLVPNRPIYVSKPYADILEDIAKDDEAIWTSSDDRYAFWYTNFNRTAVVGDRFGCACSSSDGYVFAITAEVVKVASNRVFFKILDKDLNMIDDFILYHNPKEIPLVLRMVPEFDKSYAEIKATYDANIAETDVNKKDSVYNDQVYSIWYSNFSKHPKVGDVFISTGRSNDGYVFGFKARVISDGNSIYFAFDDLVLYHDASIDGKIVSAVSAATSAAKEATDAKELAESASERAGQAVSAAASAAKEATDANNKIKTSLSLVSSAVESATYEAMKARDEASRAAKASDNAINATHSALEATRAIKDLAASAGVLPLFRGVGDESVEQGIDNSRALSENSAAFGENNIAGAKGYYFNNIDFDNKKIRLTATQPTGNDPNEYNKAGLEANNKFESGWEVNDVISVINNSKYDAQFIITEIDHDILTVAVVTDKYSILNAARDKRGSYYNVELPIPFSAVVIPADQEFDDYAVVNVDKPTVGENTFAPATFVEGSENISISTSSHAEGKQNKAIGHYSHAEGRKTLATYYGHSEGYMTVADGQGAHAEGCEAKALAARAHAEGYKTEAKGVSSHAEGVSTKATGEKSHAEGDTTESSGQYSHAEGRKTVASGTGAHAEGYGSEAIGEWSHAEGYETKAQGAHSHAEGNKAHATGHYSHAEGQSTIAAGIGSHAEGVVSQARADKSHAGGDGTIIEHEGAFGHGRLLNSARAYQAIFGTGNKPNEKAMLQVGIGDSVSKINAFEVLDDGTFNYKDSILGYTNINNVTTNIRDSINSVKSNLNEKTSAITEVVDENNKYLTTVLENIVGKNYKELSSEIYNPSSYFIYDNNAELARINRTDTQSVNVQLPKVYNISGNLIDRKQLPEKTYASNGLTFKACENGGIRVYGTVSSSLTGTFRYLLTKDINLTDEQIFWGNITKGLFNHEHKYYMSNNSKTNKYINSAGNSEDIVKLQMMVIKTNGSIYYPNTVNDSQPITLKAGEKVDSMWLQVDPKHAGRTIDTILYPTITMDVPSSALLGNYEGRIDEVPYDTFWALHPHGAIWIDDNVDSECKITTYGNKTKEEAVLESNAYTSEKIDAVLDETRKYTDNTKNELLNGAGVAYDTLKELGDLINENQNAIDALEKIAIDNANEALSKANVYTNKKVDDMTSKISSNIANPNLLINGDFAVNQTGNWSMTSGKTLFIDGWILSSADRLGTATLNADHSITITSGGGNAYLIQGLPSEDTDRLLNVPLTMSICDADNNVYSASGVTDTTGDRRPLLATSWGYLRIYYDQATNNIEFTIDVRNGKSLTVKWAKLEYGYITTPFIPRSYAEELSLCQRFFYTYRVIPKYAEQLIATGQMLSVAEDGCTFLMEVPFTTEMRTTPTLIDHGDFANILIRIGNSADYIDLSGCVHILTPMSFSFSKAVLQVELFSDALKNNFSSEMIGQNVFIFLGSGLSFELGFDASIY